MADTDDPTVTAEADVPAVALAEPERPAPPPEPPKTPPAKRGGFLGMLLGGAIAAGAGFGLAQYVPGGWPLAETSALQTALEAQAKAISALQAQLAESAKLDARLAALEGAPTDLGPLSEAVAGLTERVAAIESLPQDGSSASPAAIAALGAQLAKLQTELDALKSQAATGNAPALAAETEARLKEAEAQAAQIKSEAEALTRAATARAALGRLQSALDTGAPFAAFLPDLGTDIPEALATHAETGLPSLTKLQETFPEAARTALEAALRADMGESWTERATSFLRNQTGARSLTPREGTDPDAILSRAEAALATGDLTTALTELAALPEVAQTAMVDWRAMAEQRQAGEAALKTITAAIGG